MNRRAERARERAPEVEPVEAHPHAVNITVDVLLHRMVRAAIPWREAQKMIRRAYIEAAVRVEKGNKTQAMNRIGMHRNSVYR